MLIKNQILGCRAKHCRCLYVSIFRYDVFDDSAYYTA